MLGLLARISQGRSVAKPRLRAIALIVVGSMLGMTGIAGATSWVVHVSSGAYPAQAQSTVVNPPTGGSATSPTSTSLLISWTAPSSGAPPSGYTVTRNGSPVPSGSGCYGTINSTSCTDSGLAASTTYTYTVTAVSGSNWTSTASSSFQGTTNAASTPADPQFVDASTYEDPYSYNVTLNVPTGVSAGDLLIAVLYTGNPTGYPGDPTTVAMPADWTVLSNATSPGAEPLGAILTAYHVATASEPPSYTFSSTNFNNVTAVMLAYANSDGTTPVIDESTWNSTMTSSELTPSTSNDTLITIFGDYNGALMSVASPAVGVGLVGDSVYASTFAADEYLTSGAPAPVITPSGNSGQGVSVTILLKY